MMLRAVFLSGFLVAGLVQDAGAKTICTIVRDIATGTEKAEGDCDTRMTPASTFKVALALTGYDSGYLESETVPELPFKQGYADWGGDAWRQDTTPAHWLKYSVVWYSQQITQHLGAEKITQYLQEFGFGNADFSGDAGFDNGLERAWIASSLEISPREQARYLSAMLRGELPVSSHAAAMTQSIVQSENAQGGWIVHGKTGLAFPRNADRSFNRARAIGWYVGWAQKEGRTVTFARLIQDEKREDVTPSTRAKDSILDDLSAYAD